MVTTCMLSLYLPITVIIFFQLTSKSTQANQKIKEIKFLLLLIAGWDWFAVAERAAPFQFHSISSSRAAGEEKWSELKSLPRSGAAWCSIQSTFTAPLIASFALFHSANSPIQFKAVKLISFIMRWGSSSLCVLFFSRSVAAAAAPNPLKEEAKRTARPHSLLQFL